MTDEQRTALVEKFRSAYYYGMTAEISLGQKMDGLKDGIRWTLINVMNVPTEEVDQLEKEAATLAIAAYKVMHS